jgi:hypothetical protein
MKPQTDKSIAGSSEASVGTSPQPMPLAYEAVLSQLHPTQMTVGYAEVLLKRQQWRALDERGKIAFIAGHALPGVLGPKGRRFIIDHHHLARALFKEHVELVLFKVLADFSALDRREFWTVMDYWQWVHAYDAEGRKHPYGDLPKSVSGLADDPYRSLAAAVRMAGAFPKEQTPFAEFLWADFFRRRISAKLLAKNPSAALSEALPLAHDQAARHLPGWTASSS